jgi:uncharacterized protein YggE
MQKVSVAALVASLALVGCGHHGEGHHPRHGGQAAEDAGIVVSGEGDANAPPDCAVVRVGIEAHRPSMAEARAASAAAQQKVLASLQARGVAPADVQTEQLSLSPQYDYGEKGRTLRGYVATNTVRVTLRNPAIAGDVVDATVAAGGDDTRVDGISFELEDQTAIRARARERAIADARGKATQLAKELGVQLGEVLAVEETVAASPGPMYMRAEAKSAGAGPSTPVAAGAIEARVGVRVRWAIGK